MSASKKRSRKEIGEMVRAALKALRFVDFHVHTMPRCCGDKLALNGPDALFDYHYAYGEVMSELKMNKAAAAKFWAMSQKQRVDFIAKHLFGRGLLPVSEASLGILTAANALGLPTSGGSMKRLLREWREMYADLGPERYLDLIFKLSRIRGVISTQSPFVEAELDVYLDQARMDEWDPRYACGLRFDEYVHKPKIAQPLCKRMGFEAAAGALTSAATQAAARKLLKFWIGHLPDVKYVALSLPGTTDFSDRRSRIMLTLEKVMIPVCQEMDLPVVLMPFVRRQINPDFKNAGDVVERGDVNGLIDFCSRHLDSLFLITPMHEGDNFDLAFAVRALGNIRVWGHWWGNLNPVLIKQQLELRLQMNGFAQFGINSDARIDDQLLFKWPHYFRILEEVLVERCLAIQELSGWPITQAQITETIRRLQDYKSLLKLARAA